MRRTDLSALPTGHRTRRRVAKNIYVVPYLALSHLIWGRALQHPGYTKVNKAARPSLDNGTSSISSSTGSLYYLGTMAGLLVNRIGVLDNCSLISSHLSSGMMLGSFPGEMSHTARKDGSLSGVALRRFCTTTIRSFPN